MLESRDRKGIYFAPGLKALKSICSVEKTKLCGTDGAKLRDVGEKFSGYYCRTQKGDFCEKVLCKSFYGRFL